MQQFIPISEFRTLEYNSQQNSISFTHGGQKFWYQLGSDRGFALQFVDQFRKSKTIEVNADDTPTNGSHVVQFMVLFYEPQAGSQIDFGWLAFAALAVVFAVVLFLTRTRRAARA